MKVGSLVRLSSHFVPNTYSVLGIIIAEPNEVSAVRVWWTDNAYPQFVHMEELDVIAI